jgi:putative peptidoglycan lipid II flippase
MAMGWAVLVAGILQLAFLLPSMRELGLLTWPRWGWRDPQVRQITRLMAPTLLSSSVSQVNLLLDTIVISLLITGSQSWFSLSTRFLELPLGVFGVALGTVTLPALARHHFAKDLDGFSKLLDWGLRITLLISVPAMLALLFLSEPIVATLFEHGRFSAFDAHMSTLSIMVLSCGLPAFALVKILLPAFYARQDTRTPMKAAILTLLINMLFNGLFVALLYQLWAAPALHQGSWLAGIAQVPGLHVAICIASVVSSYFQFALLWRWLKQARVYQRQPGWLRHWLRLGVSCAAMVVVLSLGRWLWPDWTHAPVFTRAWHLAVLVVAGALAYVGAMVAGGFRMHELRGA